MNSLIKKLFSSSKLEFNPFYSALFSDNVEEMKKYINDSMKASFPPTDITENEDNPENFYYVFILGLIADLKSNFQITSNEEKEHGFFYVQIESLDRKRYPDSYIFEFMIKDDDDKNLKETAERALMQITSNNYNKKLIKNGFALENIKNYAFGFWGQECEIMLQTAKKLRHPELSPPRFDKPRNHVFLEKENVFIIDKNEFDIWEGTIQIINDVQYLIHYPDYPEDDETVGLERILPKTNKNKQIYMYQEEKRQKYLELINIKKEENGCYDENKKKSPKRRKKKHSY